MTDRASKFERKFDTFAQAQMLTGLHELIVRTHPLPIIENSVND
jgi:hypothetical protein